MLVMFLDGPWDGQLQYLHEDTGPVLRVPERLPTPLDWYSHAGVPEVSIRYRTYSHDPRLQHADTGAAVYRFDAL